MIALCLIAAGCGSGSSGNGFSIGFGLETENRAAIERFVALRDRYFVRHLLFNPVTATYLGAHEYSDVLQSTNGSLKDYSEATLARELAFYRESLEELLSIAPESLPSHHQVDHHVMDAQLTFLERLIAGRKYHQRAVDTYTAEPVRGLDWQQQQMQDFGNGLRGTEADWTHLVRRVEAIPGYLGRARANLLAGKEGGNLPDWRMVQRDGVDSSLAHVDYFQRTLPEAASRLIGSRPFGQTLMPQLKQAGVVAATEWKAFADFLGTTYGTDKTDRFAAGIAEYEWRVQSILADARTTEQLYDYGAQQVALYSRHIREVVAIIAKDAGLDATTTREVISYLAKDSPRNDGELFAWYRETAARALAYGREHHMFDIPGDYKLDVLPTPPVLANSIDAAYDMAPPFMKSGAGRFYLTPTGNDPAKLKLKNRASIAGMVIHEGFPGHDWHFKYMTQHSAQISNIRWLTPGAVEDSSSMWSDSHASEGWGLYAEELMAEPVAGRPYGFYTAPEYLYELQRQMTQAVRVRIDVGIHTGRMTFDAARDYYVEHVEFYPGACGMTDPVARAACDGADREIYRNSKWPTQAIAYNLGKNAVVLLREMTRKNMGTAYSPRAFHERLMRTGTVPVVSFFDLF